MIIHYKQNRTRNNHWHGFYDASNPPFAIDRAMPRPQGPFESCGNCPYVSHGFMCYTSEGDCLKTDMEKLNQRRKAVSIHA